MNLPDSDPKSEATEALRSYRDWLVAQIPASDGQMAATRALAAATRVPRRRWLVVVAVAGLLAISNVGLAAVSDTAVPGDPLYGLKRAYERVSDLFGEGSHVAERLREAEVLLTRGESNSALAVTEEALAELEVDTNLTDLLEGVPVAADPELIAETGELVELAREIHEAAKGSADRQIAISALREQAARVAEIARSQNASQNDPGDHPGQGPGDNPGQGQGPPDDSPSATAPANTNSQDNRP